MSTTPKPGHNNNVGADSMPLTYIVKIHPAYDVGGYWAACDMEKGGCTVQGETIQETQTLMHESVAFYLEDYPEIKNYRLEFVYHDA